MPRTILPHVVPAQIAEPVARAVARTGITPNAITAIGFLGNLFAAWLAADGRWLAAGLVASAFGIRGDALLKARRGTAEVAVARQAAMYLAHTRLSASYTLAGAFFGRDRTTAAHACRKTEERREDARFDGIIACLERAIDVWPDLARLTGQTP